MLYIAYLKRKYGCPIVELGRTADPNVGQIQSRTELFNQTCSCGEDNLMTETKTEEQKSKLPSS